jgi:hypothetical protein
MNSWASFLIGLLSILAARRRSQRAVRLYFNAQLIATCALFMGVRLLGDHATLYAILYGAVTLPIFECCCFMIWEGRLDVRLYLASINFGIFMGIIGALGMTQHPVEDFVTFFEGVFLSIIGLSLLQVASTCQDRLAVRTIGILSLAQSCYDFGFFRNESWYALNGWLPSTLGIAAFGWIALSPRRSPS